MTIPTRRRAITRKRDKSPAAAWMVPLMAPWIATGRATPRDSCLFAAALESDPALADELAAARCEHLAFQELAEEGGRPSQRPLIDLFAAIAADDDAAPAFVSSPAVAPGGVSEGKTLFQDN